VGRMEEPGDILDRGITRSSEEEGKNELEEEFLKLEEELEREQLTRQAEKEAPTRRKPSTRQPLPDIVRISTGIPELDRALEGGIPKGSWVAITGEPGTGKSILCMHFALAGLQAGDPVVYVTTESEFRDVVRQAKMFGMDFEEHRIYDISSPKEPAEAPEIVVIDIFGLLKIARQRAEESGGRRLSALSIENLIEAIREAYAVLGVLRDERAKSPMRHVRLIIDSISAFWADKPAMARKYSYELKVATHRENVTAYLVSQYAMTTRSTFGFGLEHIADGVFHLWMDEVETAKEVRRYMIIKKMRMTNHYRKAFILDIVPSRGMVVKAIE